MGSAVTHRRHSHVYEGSINNIVVLGEQHVLIIRLDTTLLCMYIVTPLIRCPSKLIPRGLNFHASYHVSSLERLLPHFIIIAVLPIHVF